MASFGEIYTADDMPPVAVVGQNVSPYTQGRFTPYQVEWVEQLPAGEASTLNFGALAANTWAQLALVTSLQLDENQLVQVRFEPLDDFEIRMWQLRGVGRFMVKNMHCTISRMTAAVDPLFKQTTIFILGKDRDAYMELYNPRGYALTQTRVRFWGWRFSLNPLDKPPAQTVYIPAEGKGN